jgi:exodeoxyribonuclease V alpha subunit
MRSDTELLGVVKRIVYASDDGTFMVVRFVVDDEDDMVTLAGSLPGVTEGERLRVNGQWKAHRQHGQTFEVDTCIPIVPTSEEHLAEFLGGGLVKGIGPATARRIVETFGVKTVEILDEAPERLVEVKGLKRAKAEALAAVWREKRQMHDVMVALARAGISPALARRLFKHYEGNAAAILRTNPYQASLDVPGIGFATADRIAAESGIARDAPARIRAALAHLLERASDSGHTYLPREQLLEGALDLLGLEAPPIEAVLDSETSQARALKRIALTNGIDAIFMGSLYKSESGCSRLLNHLIDQSKPLMKGDASSLIAAFEERFRFQLAAQQREAIHSILGGGISVVTGGPGTGKTTLVRALLYVLDAAGHEVLLCSPTGRAAQRLAETTHREAMTIHRLLKYNAQTHRFTQGPDNPLKMRVLIVDESSMLDIVLAYHLLGAIPPGASIVFVGDVDQLPSVGPGQFLADLIASSRVRTTRLSVVFRQARESAIVTNAHRINSGEMPLGEDAEDFFLVRRDEAEGLQNALLEMVAERIPRKFGFDPIRDIQVLTPMRRGALGTNELNRLLQERLNPGPAMLRLAGMGLRIGDKVIQNSNNYELEVFNGDLGVVQSINRESMTLNIQFGKRPVEYRWDESDQLSLAYAVTIHKSQGSEYPAVVVVLHTQHFVLLQRNLLYTGITRGKKLVVLIGSNRAIAMAVRNAEGSRRNSALAEWMSRPPEATDLAGS